MRQHNYHVYITTNPSKTVLYIGITNNLERRLTEHFYDRIAQQTFAGKYHCYNLLYYEHFTSIDFAIAREYELKGWSRKKKLELIRKVNPDLDILNNSLFGSWPPAM